MAFNQLSGSDIAIDIGTNNIRIYVKNKGVVIYETSVLLISGRSARDIRAVGDESLQMIGRSPDGVRTVYPIRDGVIVDYEMAQMLIHYLVSKAIGDYHFRKPRAVVTIPGELTPVERNTVENAVKNSGIGSVFLVEQAFTAALGAGLSVFEAKGSMIVQIGAGTTEVALISMGGEVISKTIRVAGNQLNADIQKALEEHCGIRITDFVAEQLKLDLADAMLNPEKASKAVVRGRDMVTNMPSKAEVTSTIVCDAIKPTLREILGAIKSVLSSVPPELAADVLHKGIYLTGGTANLAHLDTLIEKEFGVPVCIPDDREPGEYAILGAGYIADNYDAFGKPNQPGK